MVKVAFVTPGAYPVPSPNGGSVERVVEKFVPLLAPGIEATIYGRIGPRLPAKGNLDGVACERFSAASKARYRERVARRLASTRPDVIEIENRPLLAAYFRRRFPHARIWLHLHSNTFINKPYLSASALPGCLAQADRILVNSEYLRAYVAERAPRLAGRIGVVYPGVDAYRFAGYSKEAERSSRGWRDRRIVLFVGRLIPLKGVHHLLEAMAELKRRFPDILLVVVGGAQYGSRSETAYVRKLHRLAKPHARHVHFQPYVPYPEVPRWFALADVAAVPTVRREAFGLVNVEAMAAGLPVVASRVGGMTEIVEDGSTGYLIDPRHMRSELIERISALLGNEELRAEMGRRGRARVQACFSWRQTAERWERQLAASGLAPSLAAAAPPSLAAAAPPASPAPSAAPPGFAGAGFDPAAAFPLPWIW